MFNNKSPLHISSKKIEKLTGRFKIFNLNRPVSLINASPLIQEKICFYNYNKCCNKDYLLPYFLITVMEKKLAF